MPTQAVHQNPQAEAIASCFSQQREFFATQTSKDLDFRLKSLGRLKDAILKYESQLAQALHKDLRKHPFESYLSETGMVLNEIGTLRKHLKDWAKPRKVGVHLAHFKAESYVLKEPYGQVLVIAPWNYPVLLTLSPLAAALAAGNTVILKPSELTPHTSSVIEVMLGEFFPSEYVAVFQGQSQTSQDLLQLPFDKIFFTGSTRVGKIVMRMAAEHLTPVTLELGGKSPCIVDRDAHLKHAAKRVIWGKFLNAGQTCVAPDYLLVHSSIKKRFLPLLKETLKEFYGPDPQKSPDYPRVVNLPNLNRLLALLEGQKVVAGGQHDADDLYLAPTLLDEVDPESLVMQDEIFGPILPILEFEELDQAIAFVNRRPKPLALYYFGETESRQSKVLAEISFGGGCLNETVTHLLGDLPFGGVGASGMGNYHGPYSFDTFSHEKGILSKSNLLDLPLRYPPYNKTNFEVVKTLLS